MKHGDEMPVPKIKMGLCDGCSRPEQKLGPDPDRKPNVRAEAAELNARFEHDRATLLEQALAAKDAELVRLRTEVAAWESSDIGDLRVELAAANEQIEKLRQRCEDFKAQFDSKVKVVEQLRAENERMKHNALVALGDRDRQEEIVDPVASLSIGYIALNARIQELEYETAIAQHTAARLREAQQKEMNG